jgi:hypothetical protein
MIKNGPPAWMTSAPLCEMKSNSKTEEEVDEIIDATRKSETFFTEDFEIV